MTLYLLDIASYQAGMDLAVAKRAGFSLVNIKTSQGNWYTHTAAKSWADKARALDMGICTFHWLDNSASGRAQADIAYRRMREIGGPDGMAHQLDCEDTATQQIMRDYVDRMQDLLGRHIVVYTGDWWWQPRGWRAADLAPYLWAAPNAGYLSAYPGDTSPHWHAGYGGWGDYSILQYAVAPVSGAGGGNVSKSALRDPKVWAALTGASAPQQPAEDDMEQADRLVRDTGFSGRTVGDVLADMERLRNVLWGVPEASAYPAPAGSPLAQIMAMATTPPGTVTITDEQLERVLRKVLGMAPAT